MLAVESKSISRPRLGALIPPCIARPDWFASAVLVLRRSPVAKPVNDVSGPRVRFRASDNPAPLAATALIGLVRWILRFLTCRVLDFLRTVTPRLHVLGQNVIPVIWLPERNRSVVLGRRRRFIRIRHLS